MPSYPKTQSYLNSYGSSTVEEQKTRLKSFGKGGGNLESSLTYKPFNNGTDFGVNFYMDNTYGNFVDKGVEGWQTGRTKSGGKSIYKFKPKDGNHTPKRSSEFIKSLMKWASRKGVPKGAVFAIRRNIWAKGIETTNFFTIPIARSEKRFQAGIEKALEIDIENNIKQGIK